MPNPERIEKKPSRANDPPKDLQDLLQKCYQIKRFTRIYKEGIFEDNTGSHIARCVDMVDELDIDEKDKEIIKLILWVHDIPEIEISDYSIIQKNSDQKLNNKLENSEVKAANKLIPAKYLKCFNDFKNAEDLLSGKTPEVGPSKHALIAKIIDTVEGNETFHEQLTNWIASDKYYLDSIPSQKSLEYSFDHYVKIHNTVFDRSEIFGNFTSTANHIIDREVDRISEFWSKIDELKIPETIKKGIKIVESVRS